MKNLSTTDKKIKHPRNGTLLSHAEEDLRALILILILQEASSAPVTNVTQWHLRYCGVVGVWFYESRLKAFISVCSSQKSP